MKITPLNGYVVIKPMAAEEVTKSGIVIPDTANKEKVDTCLRISSDAVIASAMLLKSIMPSKSVEIFNAFGIKIPYKLWYIFVILSMKNT